MFRPVLLDPVTAAILVASKLARAWRPGTSAAASPTGAPDAIVAEKLSRAGGGVKSRHRGDLPAEDLRSPPRRGRLTMPASPPYAPRSLAGSGPEAGSLRLESSRTSRTGDISGRRSVKITHEGAMRTDTMAMPISRMMPGGGSRVGVSASL